MARWRVQLTAGIDCCTAVWRVWMSVDVVGSAEQSSGSLRVFPVGAVMAYALRVNRSSTLCSACVRRAPCGSAVNPERASDFDLHFRHAPCHAAAASRSHLLEDTQNVILPPYTAFKMPLGRFACLESLLQLLES